MAVSISGDGAVTGVASINTDVSSTELGYLDGVTSAIQPQIAGAGGLVLIHSESFSPVSSKSFENVFSSTYREYRFTLSYTMSASSVFSWRGRTAGGDVTAGYHRSGWYSASGGSSGTFYQGNNQDRVVLTDKRYGAMSFDIMRPNVADTTLITGKATGWNSTDLLDITASGMLDTGDQLTGMTLLMTSGTISGYISVYGYAQ